MLLPKVYVEPALCLYYIALSLTMINGQNLLLQKACHSGDSAPPPSLQCLNEVEAQRSVAQIETWKHIIYVTGSLFFVLFAGPWSDSHDRCRKPLMYLPLCGQILADLLCMLNVYFWSWSTEVAALSETISVSITGGRWCFIIGANSYTADKSSTKSRTLRIGICTAFLFLGSPIGSFLYGLVYKRIGLLAVYLLSVVFNLTSLMYLYVFVSENKPENGLPSRKAWEGLLDPKQALQSFKTIFKPRDEYSRAIVLLAVLNAPLTMASLQGENSVMFYFVRHKFQWKEADYGFYTAYKFFIVFCGSLLTLGVLSRLAKISDAVIGMMSSVTLLSASLGYSLTTESWEMMLYAAVDFMHGAGLAVVFSIVSKTVDSAEIGQVNGMIGVMDAAYPLVNFPLYIQVYRNTINQMPGAFFLISVGYSLTTLVIFVAIYVLQRKQAKQQRDDSNNQSKL